MENGRVKTEKHATRASVVPVMLLLHHFNVFEYNSTSIVMFVCFYCYLSSAVIFFLIYHFVTAKAALAKKSLVFAARQIANNLSSEAKIL